MTPQFKFTIYHNVIAPNGLAIPQPLGWKDTNLSFERDKLYHSIVEYFKGTFVWYGLAHSTFKNIEFNYGPEALVRLVIEINYGRGWDLEPVFDGLVDLPQLDDIAKSNTFYKTVIPVIRDDFWTKLIANRSVPYAISTANKITLPLPSQVVRLRYLADSGELGTILEPNNGGFSEGITNGRYYQVDLPIEILNEIRKTLVIELKRTHSSFCRT
jgi:hypothetical protein